MEGMDRLVFVCFVMGLVLPFVMSRSRLIFCDESAFCLL